MIGKSTLKPLINACALHSCPKAKEKQKHRGMSEDAICRGGQGSTLSFRSRLVTASCALLCFSSASFC